MNSSNLSISEIEARLSSSPTIYGTPHGEAYPGPIGQGGILEITTYKILKGNNNISVIYYERDASPDPDYILYQFDDYGITWAFSPEELASRRGAYLAQLAAQSPLEKFLVFINPDRDTRLDADLIRSIIQDLSKLTQEDK